MLAQLGLYTVENVIERLVISRRQARRDINKPRRKRNLKVRNGAEAITQQRPAGRR